MSETTAHHEGEYFLGVMAGKAVCTSATAPRTVAEDLYDLLAPLADPEKAVRIRLKMTAERIEDGDE